MEITIYRVASDVSNAEDFVAVDEQRATSIAASRNTDLLCRDFTLPEGWVVYEIDEEELLFDAEKNPYTVRLHGDAPTTPTEFNVIAIPIFQGAELVLEPAK